MGVAILVFSRSLWFNKRFVESQFEPMATAPDANPGNGAVVEGGFTMLGGAGDDLPSYEEALTHPTHISASPSQSYPNVVSICSFCLFLTP